MNKKQFANPPVVIPYGTYLLNPPTSLMNHIALTVFAKKRKPSSLLEADLEKNWNKADHHVNPHEHVWFYYTKSYRFRGTSHNTHLRRCRFCPLIQRRAKKLDRDSPWKTFKEEASTTLPRKVSKILNQRNR